MPNLYFDQSIPAVTWRGGIGDGQFSLKRMRDDSFEIINQSRSGKLLHHPVTVVGLHNGIPQGQDQDYIYNQKIDMNPYPMGKNPFLSDSVEDMYPKTYGEANPMGGTNGTIMNVSSIAGTPLAMALDDGIELFQRIHSEKFRMDPKNPLSGEFALAAFLKNKLNPETGPMSDYMRMGLAADAEDAYVLNQQLAAGFLREELNNIPDKIREKLKKRNNLNKVNQNVKSTEDRLQRTDVEGRLNGGRGNSLTKLEKQRQAQNFTSPTGGEDGPGSVQRDRNNARTLQQLFADESVDGIQYLFEQPEPQSRGRTSRRRSGLPPLRDRSRSRSRDPATNPATDPATETQIPMQNTLNSPNSLPEVQPPIRRGPTPHPYPLRSRNIPSNFSPLRNSNINPRLNRIP